MVVIMINKSTHVITLINGDNVLIIIIAIMIINLLNLVKPDFYQWYFVVLICYVDNKNNCTGGNAMLIHI